MYVGWDDANDVARGRRLMPLVEEGFAASLTEAATRFALSHPAMGTILVGMATPQQFENALAAVQKGPLPPAALDRLSAAAGIRRRTTVMVTPRARTLGRSTARPARSRAR
jgi:aryl-alcohol dehydrogenase-like predicted oxidoreductase